MNSEILYAHYDAHNSFYKKAHVQWDDAEPNKEYLKSYSTIVAWYDRDKDLLYIDGTYSKTTRRHIREFARQHGVELKRLEHGYFNRNGEKVDADYNGQSEKEYADETCAKFEAAYNSLSQERKDMLARSNVMMRSMEDVKSMTSFMNIMSACDMCIDLCQPNN